MDRKIAQWASDPPVGYPGLVTIPTGKQEDGWANGEEPPAGYVNHAFAAVADVQNEVANAIEGSGVTPSAGDLTQLLKAIRMQGAKSAFGLRLAEDMGAEPTLRAIARKPSSPAGEGLTPTTLVVVGEDGTIFQSPTGQFAAITPGSSFADDFTDVVYDPTNSLFLMCGENGEIQSWISGGTATRRNTGGTADFQAIATDGLGHSVAVGSAGLIKYSSNGTAWSTGTDPWGGAFIDDVAFGAGLFVASSYSGKIATSPTGQTWTLRTVTGWVAAGISRVEYHPTIGFIAYAGTSAGEIHHSPDGITWTRILDGVDIAPESLPFVGPYCWGIISLPTNNGTSARVYFGTAAGGAPYFDYDFISENRLQRLTILDGQIYALFEDKVYVGGVL